jgi:hypothetical protein
VSFLYPCLAAGLTLSIFTLFDVPLGSDHEKHYHYKSLGLKTGLKSTLNAPFGHRKEGFKKKLSPQRREGR